MLSSAALTINARLLTIPQSSEKGALPRCSAPSLAGGLGASRQLFLLGQAVLSAGCNPATLLPAREGEKTEERGGRGGLYASGWPLFFFFRSFFRSGDMKYGFSAEPSFRSRSSTATRNPPAQQRGPQTGVGTAGARSSKAARWQRRAEPPG